MATTLQFSGLANLYRSRFEEDERAQREACEIPAGPAWIAISLPAWARLKAGTSFRP